MANFSEIVSAQQIPINVSETQQEYGSIKHALRKQSMVNSSVKYSVIDKELSIVLEHIDAIYKQGKKVKDITYTPDDNTSQDSETDSDYVPESAKPVFKRNLTLPSRKPKLGHDPQYKCKYCGLILLSDTALDTHLVQHQGVTFVCQECGKTLRSQ